MRFTGYRKRESEEVMRLVQMMRSVSSDQGSNQRADEHSDSVILKDSHIVQQPGHKRQIGVKANSRVFT